MIVVLERLHVKPMDARGSRRSLMMETNRLKVLSFRDEHEGAAKELSHSPLHAEVLVRKTARNGQPFVMQTSLGVRIFHT